MDQNEIIEWLQCDSTQTGYQSTDDEIIKSLKVEENVDADYDGSEIHDVVTKKDERKEACQVALNIEKFVDEANNTDTMILRRLRNLALKNQKHP